MKLKTPFTILNRKFNELDYIRHSMKSKEKSATENCTMTTGKCSNLILALCIAKKNFQLLSNGYVWSTYATDLPQ